jgi:hypothetical protein
VVHIFLVASHGGFNDEGTGSRLENWRRKMIFGLNHAATRRQLTIELQMHGLLASKSMETTEN